MFTRISITALSEDNRSISYKKMNAFVVVFDFMVLWYYFFSGTLVLRPMVSVFWFVCTIIGMFLFEVKAIELNTYNSLCILGMLAVFLSVPQSIDTEASAKYAFSIIMYMLIAYQLTSCKANMSMLLKIMTVFSVFLVAVTYVQALNPKLYKALFLPFMPQHFHERIITFMSNKSHTGFYNQTSANAVAMSLGCFLSVYMIAKSIYSKKINWKIIGFILLLVFLFGLILTNRRGSTISVCVILLCFFMGKIRSPYFRVMLIIGISVFIASGAWNDITVLENLINKTEKYASEGDVTNGRLAIWSESFRLFWNGPIFGYGADTYGYIATEGYAHNSYLQSLVELGLIGAILFYVPYIYGFVRTIRLFKNKECYSVEYRSIIEFCLYWQAYCLMNAFFESFFASEISVFMFYIAQMICICIEKETDHSTKNAVKLKSK